VQFFSRKIFLDGLGDEFIGLTGTLQSFLKFLNLAELGIGAAVGYTLYKPLFDDDRKSINQLITLFGFLYQKIGFIILGAGVVLSLFFPLIFDDLSVGLWIPYYAFYTFLAGLLLNFFFNYHLFLLEADQKNYIITSYAQSINLIKIILQAVTVLYFKNIFLWITLELLYHISFSFFLRKRVFKEYPWLESSTHSGKSLLKVYPELIKKVKQISIHKLGGFVTNGTDQILIFSFISVEMVAFYGNYQLIFSRLLQLVNTTFAGTAAGIGNLVAENDKTNIKKVFWEMMSLRFFIAGTLFMILFYLVEPFIVFWLGEKYVLKPMVLTIFLTNMFISQIRVPVDHFKDAYGLFQDIGAPIVQSIINLTSSIILLHYFELAGVLMGTLIAFSLVIMIWRPYYLYKHGFKESVWNYWIGFFRLTISFIISLFISRYLISNYIILQSSTLFELMIYGIKSFFTVFLIYFPCIYLLNKGFRNVMVRLKKLFK
tara:strand:+ start:252 stop:1709 length:1458 start_codon:yes stop_codon:yes gene_type:complete